MPYKVRKRGSKWVLVRENGTIKSRHDTKQLAESARGAIAGKEHGWRPSGKKARYKRKK